MYSEELLKLEDLQPFINQPETLINQTLEFQLQVANYLQTPRQLLEILANDSPHALVVEAVKLHVNLAGEMVENWQVIAENAIKNTPLEQNDRLVAELLKIAPVPEYLISEWIPGNRLIEGLENPYLPQKDKVKLLERLAKSTIIEERLKAAAHPDTPREILEILAGDLELPIRIAVKYRDDSLEDIIEVIENQHEIAANWETNSQQLVELAGSRWSWIRQAVARNFYTPVEVLRGLVGDREEKIQLAIARNLATPAEVLDLLVNHGWGEVTESIAKHPNASEDALIKLLPRYNYYIKERVNLSSNILEALAKDENKRFYRMLLDNPNTRGIDLAKKILSFNYLFSCIRLASHPNATVSILEELAKHYYQQIRVDVYKNPSTPEYIKNKLLQNFRKISKKQKEQKIWLFEELTTDDIHKKIFQCGNIPVSDYKIICHLKTQHYILEKFNKLYRILLNKEITEENQKARSFIGKNCKNIEQFKEYALKNGHTQSRNALAYKLDTPLHVFEELIKDSNAKVRAKLAQNPNLPLHCLVELAKDSDVSVRKKLLDFYSRRDKLPVKVLEILKEDESEEVRVLLASYKNTTSEILSYLANDSSLEVKKKVGSNSNTSAKTLELLWRNYQIFDEKNHNIPSHIVVEKIANTHDSEKLCKIIEGYLRTYPQVPANILEKLSLHKSSILRCRVAKHPNTPIIILETLATDVYSVTRWNLASNPNTPPHVLEYLWNNWEYCEGKYDKELCRRLAQNINTPANTLEKLSLSKSYQVCSAAIDNPKIPLSTLKKFANRDFLKNIVTIDDGFGFFQSWEYFLSQLCYQSRLTPEILEMLANDISPKVRSNLIAHPNITIEIQTKLANDESPEVRKVIAGYRNSPIVILELLTIDESPEVRQALAKNSNASSSILETLALDISPDIRKAVAENNNTSITVLKQLALDTHKGISQSIINNPNTPLNIKQNLQYRLRVKISPTLKGLTRLYNPENDDLPTLLSEYIHSQVPFVRFISLMHPLIPVEILQQYSQSLLWWERYAIAINSSTPLKIRERLTEDCNFIVKAAAKYS